MTSFPSGGVYPVTRRRTEHKTDRKSRQLCEQVKDAFLGILSGMADEQLRDLTVVMVEPAPNTGRLRVTVAGPDPADATDPTTRIEVVIAFARAGGYLRSEVARSIHRKHTPELIFQLV